MEVLGSFFFYNFNGFSFLFSDMNILYFNHSLPSLPFPFGLLPLASSHPQIFSILWSGHFISLCILNIKEIMQFVFLNLAYFV
jgi:hypothetical protein